MKLIFDASDSYSLSEFAFNLQKESRFVVFDLEATGPDETTDNITQIGAVAVYPSGPCDEESFTSLVCPMKEIPKKIEVLTGLTNDMVSNAPNFHEVFLRFLEFCAGSPLVTQCGYEFDFPLLDRECEHIGQPKIAVPRLDTKALFALMHRDLEDTFSTNFISDYYGVDRTQFKRHDALGDAKLISRFFHLQLREALQKGAGCLHTDLPVRIKRFILPPL